MAAAASEGWNHLAHDAPVRLAENLWWVRGALPGMSLQRTMVVVKRDDGTLLIHSAIAMAEPSMQQLESWGAPSVLVVPSAIHRMDAAAFKRRYPQLRVYCPGGARAKVQEVVGVDGVYQDFPSDRAVRFEPLQGIGDKEGAMLVHSSDGISVVLNDVMFNMKRKHDPLGWLFTTLLGSAPGPRVSRLARWTLVNDRRALRADFERLAALPELTRVIVAHEDVASGADAERALRMAATYL